MLHGKINLQSNTEFTIKQPNVDHRFIFRRLYDTEFSSPEGWIPFIGWYEKVTRDPKTYKEDLTSHIKYSLEFTGYLIPDKDDHKQFTGRYRLHLDSDIRDLIAGRKTYRNIRWKVEEMGAQWITKNQVKFFETFNLQPQPKTVKA